MCKKNGTIIKTKSWHSFNQDCFRYTALLGATDSKLDVWR